MQANGKVDFLVVGTQKGGTTALAAFLAQHPQIFIPAIKEAHFFDRAREYGDGGATRYATYHQLFAAAAPDQLWGEATPIYMFLPVVADRIRDYNPAIRLIFILRDPVARAFSHYKMQRARQREHLPFALAAAVEVFRVRLFSRDPDRNKDPIRIHSYLSRGFYARQIERFLCRFPGENLLFLKSEELLASHEQVMRRVFGFLGVNADFRVPPARAFVGAEGKLNPLLARALGLIYRRERRRVEALTRLDLSDWNNGRA